MHIKCIENTGKNLSKTHFSMGYTSVSEFDLELGKDYSVYGISWWSGVVFFLLLGEGGYPRWCPSELFTITQNTIPADWFFATFLDGQKNGLQAILSYDEMVNSLDEHYDALLEYEPEAIKVFFRRKDEIDCSSDY